MHDNGNESEEMANTIDKWWWVGSNKSSWVLSLVQVTFQYFLATFLLKIVDTQLFYPKNLCFDIMAESSMATLELPLLIKTLIHALPVSQIRVTHSAIPLGSIALELSDQFLAHLCFEYVVLSKLIPFFKWNIFDRVLNNIWMREPILCTHQHITCGQKILVYEFLDPPATQHHHYYR